MTNRADEPKLPAYFEVQAILEQYIEGIRTGNVQLLRGVFDPDARLHGYLMGTLVDGPVELFLNDVAARPPPVKSGEPFRAAIVDIHVDRRVARGTVVEESYFGLDFVDHFHLLETARGWRIVDKTFSHEPPRP